MERIRQLRQERGLSQVKLAVMADMDPATLNRLEQGKGNPNLRTLERVADALGVEVADLFPKAQAPLWSGDAPSERRELESYIRPAFDSLSRYCDALEQQLSEGNLTADKIAAHLGAAGVFGPFIRLTMRDPETRDVLTPVSARYVALARRVLEIAQQAGFGDEQTEAEVTHLDEYLARRAAS